MDDTFFRSEALETRSRKWIGSVRLAAPPSFTYWTVASVIAAVSILAFGLLGNYTRREHVNGVIVPADGLVNLTARSTGSLQGITILEGSHVRAGDIILTVSAGTISQALGDTGQIITAEIAKQRTRITEDIADAEAFDRQQAVELLAERESLKAQITKLDSQIEVQTSQFQSLKQMLDRMDPLVSKGYISGLQIQDQMNAKLSAESQLRALQRQRLELIQQRGAIATKLMQLPLDTRSKVNELRRQDNQLNETLARNEADRGVVIRAPVNGVISSLLVRPGQAVQTGQSLATIVPDGTKLEAHLLVPTSAIGFVRVGSFVALRYQAFPYQKFGLQRGIVATISHNALTAEQVSELVGHPTQESLYRVVVQPDAQTILAYGKTEPLLPGMATEADVFIDRRNLLEWLLEPLFGMRGQLGSANAKH